MIVDMNVLLGRWPFAPLKYDTVPGVLTLMDRAGIDVAAVTSLDSVFYYDCECGNRRVGEACRRYPDRFVPLAVINPHLLSWKAHLDECQDAYGVKGVKLHPDYHKYSLLDDPVEEVMAEARRLDLPDQHPGHAPPSRILFCPRGADRRGRTGGGTVS
jgi:predicted TIM-barrel fold metal-dependent hydrolase